MKTNLELHYHPLASYCWKVLIALYENETPFDRVVVDLGDETSRSAFYRLWPMGKMPALRDRARDEVVVESSIVIEHLARYFPGKSALVPTDPDAARRARFWDRFHDNYVMNPMARIVADRLRPKDDKDPTGAAESRATIVKAYASLEDAMKGRTWALGDPFTMADCAAAPALYYADKVEPIGAGRPNTAAYLARLVSRPSFARVIEEAGPYFKYFPTAD